MSNMLMEYSKNQKAAKEFLRWITSKEVYQTWFDSQQGFSVGATTDLGEGQAVGQGPGHAALPGGRARPGVSRATRDRPTARPPRC